MTINIFYNLIIAGMCRMVPHTVKNIFYSHLVVIRNKKTISYVTTRICELLYTDDNAYRYFQAGKKL